MKIVSNGVEIDIGLHGATFTPSVSEDGDLSWSNNAGLKNPETVNIKGPKGEPGVQEVSYSIGEQQIGTWVNGKPLYRYTYISDEKRTVEANTWTNMFDAASLNIDRIISITGTFQLTSGKTFKSINTRLFDLRYNPSNHFIDMYYGTDLTSSAMSNFIIFIEYTKITETAATASVPEYDLASGSTAITI